MVPFVWRDRLVKLECGTVVLSAKGRHDDFDVYPDKPDRKTMAVAMQCGVGCVTAVEALDDGRLRMLSDQWYVLFGDDFNSAHVIAEDDMTTECDAPVSVDGDRPMDEYERLARKILCFLDFDPLTHDYAKRHLMVVGILRTGVGRLTDQPVSVEVKP